MASFKICVVLAIVASVVSGQTNTYSKGQESGQYQYQSNVKESNYGQTKQGAVPSLPSFPNLGQNQQQQTTVTQTGSSDTQNRLGKQLQFPSFGFLPSNFFGGSGPQEADGDQQNNIVNQLEFPTIFGGNGQNNIFGQFQLPSNPFEGFPFFGQQPAQPDVVPANQDDYQFGQYQ